MAVARLSFPACSGLKWTWVLASALIALLQLAPVCDATLHDTGEWTSATEYYAGSDWRNYGNNYAIHMAITRGEGTPYHSHIIWWDGASEAAFGGRELAWRPFNTDCEDWADSSFIPITVAPPHLNTFCAGHTGLADGRLFIAGGNDSVNTIAGERGARVWQQGATQSSSNWTIANSMKEHRWYPTTTMLADGKVLVLTGNQNERQAIFGGRLDSIIPTQSVADSVRLYEPVPGGQWYQSVIPDPDPSGSSPHKPDWREFHTAVGMDEYSYGVRSRDTYFGGKDSLGHARNDTWFLLRDPNLLGTSYSYQWKRGPTTNLPVARSEHVAVASQGTDASMYVFGGLGENGLPRNDVQHLYKNGASWEWDQAFSDSGSPPARYGHAAFYDEIPGPSGTTLRRMIVFGGDSTGAAPTDTAVYEMRITGAHSVAWTKMTKVQLGYGSPSARFGHAMDVDLATGTRTDDVPVMNSRRDTLPDLTVKVGHVAFLFGGQTDPYTYSSELWKLWIFNDGTIGWEKMDPGGDAPVARTHATLVVDPHQGREEENIGDPDRVYLFGGEDDHGPIDKDQYEIDPWQKTPVWCKWAQAGHKASRHSTLILKGLAQARLAEVYNPASNSWTQRDSANLLQQGFGPTFLVSGGSTVSGRVFTMGVDDAAYYLDVPSSGPSSGWTAYLRGALGFDSEAMVMYRPGKIMAASGFISEHPDTNWIGRTMKFDLDHPDSAWKQAAYGSGAGSLTPRRFHNLCILPNGKVIAIGGLRAFGQADLDFATKRPQIWDPDGASGMGAWSDSSQLAVQPHKKNYHSTAILLPDGRILSAGGFGAGNDDLYYGDVYCPPYLFSGDTLATRPNLSATLGRWRYNDDVTFAASGDTTSLAAALIRAPSTTHAFDQGQRYIPLPISGSEDMGAGVREYFLKAPADSITAPPGDYMLFILNSSGVPSIAKWVRMGSTYTGQFDTTAPDTLQLEAEFITCNAIYPISWTAPGDDHSTGIALDYDVKYSTAAITTGNFGSATRLSNIPRPKLAGAVQQADGPTGLQSCTNYYFAGMTRDRAENWSALGRVKYKTLCVGGSCGFGEAMHRGRSEAASASGSKREEGGVSPLTSVPGARPFAAPTSEVEQTSTVRLVGMFAGEGGSHWEVHYEDLAGQSALLDSSTSGLVVQEALSGGGWRTRSVVHAAGGSVGVRSLARSGRTIFPTGSTIEAVELEPVGFTCESAMHSRLGSLMGSNDATASPEFVQGDTLRLSYQSSAGGDGEDCFFRVLVPGGAQQSRAHDQPRERTDGALPTSFALYPAHPNPFSRHTTIRFDLPRPASVHIEVFDVQGRRLTTLADEVRDAGRYSLSWSGATAQGRASAGVYVVRMRAGDFSAERRISLLP